MQLKLVVVWKAHNSCSGNCSLAAVASVERSTAVSSPEEAALTFVVRQRLIQSWQWRLAAAGEVCWAPKVVAAAVATLLASF